MIKFSFSSSSVSLSALFIFDVVNGIDRIFVDCVRFLTFVLCKPCVIPLSVSLRMNNNNEIGELTLILRFESIFSTHTSTSSSASSPESTVKYG